MWTTKLVVILASVAVCVLSSTVPQSRVVNGRNTTIEQHAHQLSLEYHQDHYCGAVLIRRNVALTGAHCFEKDDSHDFKNVYRIRAGTSVRNQGGQLAYLDDVIKHPQWDPNTFNFDVAVVRMCNCLDYSPAFWRVDMVPNNAFIPEGTIGTLTGYGRLWTNGDWAPVLQEVDMPIVSQQRCAEIYGTLGVEVTSNMFCAGSFTGEFDSCGGDSGGPFVSNGMLIGLVSWGNGCAEVGYPGVYTRLSVLRAWIDSQLV